MVHSVLSKVTTPHATGSVHQFVYYIEACFVCYNTSKWGRPENDKLRWVSLVLRPYMYARLRVRRCVYHTEGVEARQDVDLIAAHFGSIA